MASDRRALHGILALALVTCVAAQARAEEPSEIDRDAARALVQQGDERLQQGDLEAALTAYRRADDIMGVPTTSIEVARVELRLGHLVEAQAAFKRTLDHPKRPGEPAPFTRARDEAREQLEKLEPRIPRLTVDVIGVGVEALPEVTLDERPIEALSGILLNPGEHAVAVSAKGYVTARESFTLAEGESRTLMVELMPEPPPKPLGAPVRPTSPWLPIAYGGFGLAVAGVVVGSITGGISISDAAQLEDSCVDLRCPAELEDVGVRSITLAHVSTASFVAAGIGAAIGVTGMVLGMRKKEPAPAVSLLPAAGPSEVGASLRVRY